MDDLSLTCLPSFDPFEVSSPILSDFELLELLWKNGPVQKPLSTGQFQVSPASSALQLGDEAVPFIDENEMSMWLQYPIEDATDTCTRTSTRTSTRTGTGTTLVEKLPIEPIVPAHEEQVGSSQVARTKRKLNNKAGSRGDTNGAELGTGDKLSSRRAHKAKVHNLSERKRRERINEKLKTLQELIPRCNKSDKASMLEEAIGYVKSLQKQVQMMSMGCSMTPLMFPGAPPMGMNFGLGMNMNMNMGMGMPPFGPVMPCAQYNSPIMPMQHKQDMAPSSMFMFPHGQNPCHFPFVLPGQAQVPTTQSRSQDKSDKGKQTESTNT